MSEIKPVVSILMGSRSDLPTMENCFNQLKEFGIPFEAHASVAPAYPIATDATGIPSDTWRGDSKDSIPPRATV